MNESILIVDDDEVLGRVLGRILARDGYVIGRATTAEEAVALVRKQRPDLVLVDLCLADGNGVELAQQLRARFPGLTFILMTGCPLRLADYPDLAQDFARVLIKPLDLPTVREAIRTALGGASVHHAGREAVRG
jgi:DNA-binding NtrC family response regulator